MRTDLFSEQTLVGVSLDTADNEACVKCRSVT